MSEIIYKKNTIFTYRWVKKVKWILALWVLASFNTPKKFYLSRFDCILQTVLDCSAEKLDHLDLFASAEAFVPKIPLFTKIEADRD